MRWLLLVALLGACTRDDSLARPDPLTKPTSPTASAPPTAPPPTGCATDLDCRLTSLGEDCCDHCGQVALTLAELSARETRCATKNVKCPALDCPFEPGLARCELGKCVRIRRP